MCKRIYECEHLCVIMLTRKGLLVCKTVCVCVCMCVCVCVCVKGM